MNRGHFLLAALGGWLACVGWLTLRSDPAMAAFVLTTPWTCLVCGPGGATDVLLNLVLFAPFGVLAWLAGWRLPRLAVAAFLLTLGIEFTQGHFLIGRDATLGDVVANTLGALLGWGLAQLLAEVPRAPRLARRVAIGVLCCQFIVWLGTGFGMRPSLDGPAPWVGRFKKVGSGQVPFEGNLGLVTLDGIPVTSEPMTKLPALEDSLDLGVALTRTSATLHPEPASIVRLVDGVPRAFLRVSQVSHGITFEVRLRASALRFRTPVWRFRNALDIPVGTPWQYRWRFHAGSVEMISGAADSLATSTHQLQPMSIGLGWALIHPFAHAIDEGGAGWTALWLGSWFLLLGWCSGFGGRRFPLALGIAGLLGMAAAALLTKMPLGAIEPLSAIVGFLGGSMLARLQRRRPDRRVPIEA